MGNVWAFLSNGQWVVYDNQEIFQLDRDKGFPLYRERTKRDFGKLAVLEIAKKPPRHGYACDCRNNSFATFLVSEFVEYDEEGSETYGAIRRAYTKFCKDKKLKFSDRFMRQSSLQMYDKVFFDSKEQHFTGIKLT